MTERERNDMVREVLLQATAKNPAFQEMMVSTAAKYSANAPRPKTQPISFGEVTLFGMATLVMLALVLSGVSDVSWWVVFAPLGFEWLVKGAIALVTYFENRQHEKNNAH